MLVGAAFAAAPAFEPKCGTYAGPRAFSFPLRLGIVEAGAKAAPSSSDVSIGSSSVAVGAGASFGSCAAGSLREKDVLRLWDDQHEKRARGERMSAAVS